MLANIPNMACMQSFGSTASLSLIFWATWLIWSMLAVWARARVAGWKEERLERSGGLEGGLVRHEAGGAVLGRGVYMGRFFAGRRVFTARHPALVVVLKLLARVCR